MHKKYAQALYKQVRGKSREEAKEVLAAFAALLYRENLLAQAGKIITEFEGIYNKEEGIVEAELMSARPLGPEIVKQLEEYARKLSGAKKIQTKTAEDKNLIGGVVLEYQDKIWDASVRSSLNRLKDSLKR